MTHRPGHKAAWTIGDQGVSSATNFVFTLTCARLLTPRDFGMIALFQAGYALALGVSLAYGALPLLFRYSPDGPQELISKAPMAVRLVLGSAVLTWPLATAVILTNRGTGSLAAGFLLLGLPLLLAQDFLRYLYFGIGKADVAFAMDFVWLCSTGTFVVIAVWSGQRTSATLMACWVSGGALSALFGLLFSGMNLLERHPGWLHDNVRLGSQLLVEVLAANATSYVSLFGLSLLGGPIQVGRVRVAQTLLGPLATAAQAANLVATPRIAAEARNVLKLRRTVNQWSSVQVLIAASWTIAIIFLPSGIGTFVLRDAWTGVRSLTVILGLSAVANGFSAGPILGLRALDQAGRNVRIRLALAIPVVLTCSLGAAWRGANGYAYGCLLAGVVLAIASMTSFRVSAASMPDE